jgi:hypothetical protein
MKNIIVLKLKKDVLENALEKGKNLLIVGATDIAPNLSISAAVGKVAAEALKHTGGIPAVSRIALVRSTALVTAAGTKIGIELGKVSMENKKNRK